MILETSKASNLVLHCLHICKGVGTSCALNLPMGNKRVLHDFLLDLWMQNVLAYLTHTSIDFYIYFFVRTAFIYTPFGGILGLCKHRLCRIWNMCRFYQDSGICFFLFLLIIKWSPFRVFLPYGGQNGAYSIETCWLMFSMTLYWERRGHEWDKIAFFMKTKGRLIFISLKIKRFADSKTV